LCLPQVFSPFGGFPPLIADCFLPLHGSWVHVNQTDGCHLTSSASVWIYGIHSSVDYWVSAFRFLQGFSVSSHEREPRQEVLLKYEMPFLS
jgi:hypothetical protein